jgi:hypothetical protein
MTEDEDFSEIDTDEPEPSFDEAAEMVAEENPDALFADGFEDALIGYAARFDRTLACYDRDKCVDVLVRQGMSFEEADKWVILNGEIEPENENAPLFLTLLRPSALSKRHRAFESAQKESDDDE